MPYGVDWPAGTKEGTHWPQTATDERSMMLSSPRAVIHYAEIGVKGRNRPFFERVQAKKAAQRLEPLGVEKVVRLPGCLLARLTQPRNQEAWTAALSAVFGLAYFAAAFPAERDMGAVRATVLEHLPPGPGCHVQPRGGLVQEDDGRPMGHRQRQASLLARRELLVRGVLLLG